jgi:hypothetical protein
MSFNPIGALALREQRWNQMIPGIRNMRAQRKQDRQRRIDIEVNNRVKRNKDIEQFERQGLSPEEARAKSEALYQQALKDQRDARIKHQGIGGLASSYINPFSQEYRDRTEADAEQEAMSKREADLKAKEALAEKMKTEPENVDIGEAKGLGIEWDGEDGKRKWFIREPAGD